MVVCLAGFVLLLTAAHQVHAPAFHQTQLVPAYFNPHQSQTHGSVHPWVELCDRMNQPSIAIMNPSSGPGEEVLQEYVEALRYCHASGNEVIAYVDTAYAQRPMAEVKEEIRTYYRWYSLDGIFLDQMSADPEQPASGKGTAQTYYQELHEFIKASSGSSRIVGNPGTAWANDWQLSTPVADVLVVFEGYAQEYTDWTPPDWVFTYPASRFSHMVHTASPSQRHEMCRLSRNRNGGRIFITDEKFATGAVGVASENPWDNLPSYWRLIAPECV